MASIKLKGDTSGEITISAPAVAGTTTLELPATSSTLATQNALGVRNLIINGDMRIDQRNAGASVSTQNAYTVDRWQALASVASKYTAQQNAGSVTPPDDFTNYLGATSTSAYSVGSGDYFYLLQKVEGLNASYLKWGTASAKTVTLSFKVRSSLTGTFVVAIRSGADDAAYPATYTINSANTWETKSITISGPTSGTFATTNAACFSVWFSLGAGSGFDATANTWGSGGALSVSGATSVVGTNGATFYITGVQLEVGDTATPFEHRPYDMELARCQRYYWKMTGVQYSYVGMGFSESGFANYYCKLPVTMRTSPTVSISSLTAFNGVISAGITGIRSTYLTPDAGVVQYYHTASAGSVYGAFINPSTGYAAFSAEI